MGQRYVPPDQPQALAPYSIWNPQGYVLWTGNEREEYVSEWDALRAENPNVNLTFMGGDPEQIRLDLEAEETARLEAERVAAEEKAAREAWLTGRISALEQNTADPTDPNDSELARAIARLEQAAINAGWALDLPAEPDANGLVTDEGTVTDVLDTTVTQTGGLL